MSAMCSQNVAGVAQMVQTTARQRPRVIVAIAGAGKSTLADELVCACQRRRRRGADGRFPLRQHVEGNYLLLDEQPWTSLEPLFDFNIFLDVPRAEPVRRLTLRWTGLELPGAEIIRRVNGNDLPNADRVLRNRRRADACIQL